MKPNKSIVLLAAFALWTAGVCMVDIQPIGPKGTPVGFALLNGSFHRLTGVHMALYTLTDWLSLLPVALGAGFAVLGLGQWIRRRHIGKVDRDLLALGGFYLLVLAVYLAFECFVVNRRPVLISGVHEASYPSSTTVLVLCVGSTAVMQLKARIRHQGIRRWVCAGLILYMAAMVIGRLLSGVHWLSDIIGGALISGALVTLYRDVCHKLNPNRILT